MILIPDVKSLKLQAGTFDLAGTSGGISLCNVRDERIFLAVKGLIETIHLAIGKKLYLVEAYTPEPASIILTIANRSSPAESYDLSISPNGILVTGKGPAGLFYGMETLCQIIRQHGPRLPCCEITDSPDFPHRGFYHDVTRGKVPTLATLKSLVEKLSSYKLDQLQLYIEHAFAFKKIPDLWYDKDPLTHQEIRELDAWCWMHFIDLVPSLATFGHLYELLRIKRFAHLREVDLAAGGPSPNLWDRMAHHTIDAVNPESFHLIKSMLDEFLPLFQSRYCNICCDETFDLGAGRNRDRAAAAGKGRLYIEFVKKLVAVVREHGKTTMLWGDVIRSYPELLRELPEDLVFLNWGYDPDVTDEATRTFAGYGVRQYVCPGVQGWSRFANNIEAASGNIRAMVRFGREYRAEGVLTTDWGDCGHVNFLAGSYHGMALGAALSWHAASFPDDAAYDAAFSRIAWNDSSGRIVALLRELGSLCFYHFGNLYAWAYGLEGLWNRETEVKAMEIEAVAGRYSRAMAIASALADLREAGSFAGESIDLDEFVCAGHAVRWTLGLLAFKKRYEFNQADCPEVQGSGQRLIEEGRALLAEFEALWRRRNKESELRNVSRTFERVFERIGEIDKRAFGGGTGLKSNALGGGTELKSKAFGGGTA